MGTTNVLEEGTKHLMINVKIHKESKYNLFKYDGFIVSKADNLTYIGSTYCDEYCTLWEYITANTNL